MEWLDRLGGDEDCKETGTSLDFLERVQKEQRSLGNGGKGEVLAFAKPGGTSLGQAKAFKTIGQGEDDEDYFGNFAVNDDSDEDIAPVTAPKPSAAGDNAQVDTPEIGGQHAEPEHPATSQQGHDAAIGVVEAPDQGPTRGEPEPGLPQEGQVALATAGEPEGPQTMELEQQLRLREEETGPPGEAMDCEGPAVLEEPPAHAADPAEATGVPCNPEPAETGGSPAKPHGAWQSSAPAPSCEQEPTGDRVVLPSAPAQPAETLRGGDVDGDPSPTSPDNPAAVLPETEEGTAGPQHAFPDPDIHMEEAQGVFQDEAQPLPAHVMADANAPETTNVEAEPMVKEAHSYHKDPTPDLSPHSALPHTQLSVNSEPEARPTLPVIPTPRGTKLGYPANPALMENMVGKNPVEKNPNRVPTALALRTQVGPQKVVPPKVTAQPPSFLRPSNKATAGPPPGTASPRLQQPALPLTASPHLTRTASPNLPPLRAPAPVGPVPQPGHAPYRSRLSNFAPLPKPSVSLPGTSPRVPLPQPVHTKRAEAAGVISGLAPLRMSAGSARRTFPLPESLPTTLSRPAPTSLASKKADEQAGRPSTMGRKGGDGTEGAAQKLGSPMTPVPLQPKPPAAPHPSSVLAQPKPVAPSEPVAETPAAKLAVAMPLAQPALKAPERRSTQVKPISAQLAEDTRKLNQMLLEAEEMHDAALELRVKVAMSSNRLARLDNPIMLDAFLDLKQKAAVLMEE